MSDMYQNRAAEKLQRTLSRSESESGHPPSPPDQISIDQRLEASLGRLRGIRQVKVRSQGPVTEVTVLTLPERCESDTVDEVRVLAQRAGIDPGRLRVRVMGARGAGHLTPRRKLSSLATKRYRERFTAQVTLELEGDSLVGEVDVPMGRRFEFRSVARAILESVRSLIPYALQLENVEIFNFGPERLAVVSVSSRDDVLVGSALVRTDELDAIARATLDAINRVLNLGAIDLARSSEEHARA